MCVFGGELWAIYLLSVEGRAGGGNGPEVSGRGGAATNVSGHKELGFACKVLPPARCEAPEAHDKVRRRPGRDPPDRLGTLSSASLSERCKWHGVPARSESKANLDDTWNLGAQMWANIGRACMARRTGHRCGTLEASQPRRFLCCACPGTEGSHSSHSLGAPTGLRAQFSEPCVEGVPQ